MAKQPTPVGEEQARDAALAAAVYHWLVANVAKREQAVLDRLIGEYRAGRLNPTEMQSRLGEISALRFLLQEAARGMTLTPTDEDFSDA